MLACHRWFMWRRRLVYSAVNLELIVTRLKISSLRSLLAYVGTVDYKSVQAIIFNCIVLLEALTSRGQTFSDRSIARILMVIQHFIWRDWCSVIFTRTDCDRAHITVKPVQTECKKTMFCFFNGAEMTPSASRVIIALINNMDSQKDMIPEEV